MRNNSFLQGVIMVGYSCYLQVRGFGGVTRVRERKSDDNIRRTDTGNDTRTRRSCRKRKNGAE